MLNYLVIGLGGFAGAVSRYIVALWVGERWGRSFSSGNADGKRQRLFPYRIAHHGIPGKIDGQPSVEVVYNSRVPGRLYHLFRL